MDFQLVDIFDTKGIEYIIVIFFFLLLVPFWRMLNRPLKVGQSLAHSGGVLNYSMLQIPRGLFFNRNHSWSQLERSGLARVGLDDLLLHLTGGVSLDYLVEQGQEVKKGEVIARMLQDDKHLDILSPLSGEISHLNSEVIQDPQLLSEAPYDHWLYKIEPGNWKDETSESMLAKEAGDWTREELDRFKDLMAVDTLQTGGELVDHPLADADREIWEKFQQAFMENM